jgi:hypothetical protein
LRSAELFARSRSGITIETQVLYLDGYWKCRNEINKKIDMFAMHKFLGLV